MNMYRSAAIPARENSFKNSQTGNIGHLASPQEICIRVRAVLRIITIGIAMPDVNTGRLNGRAAITSIFNGNLNFHRNTDPV